MLYCWLTASSERMMALTILDKAAASRSRQPRTDLDEAVCPDDPPAPDPLKQP
jgi:hypothetical protein